MLNLNHSLVQGIIFCYWSILMLLLALFTFALIGVLYILEMLDNNMDSTFNCTLNCIIHTCIVSDWYAMDAGTELRIMIQQYILLPMSLMFQEMKIYFLTRNPECRFRQ